MRFPGFYFSVSDAPLPEPAGILGNQEVLGGIVPHFFWTAFEFHRRHGQFLEHVLILALVAHVAGGVFGVFRVVGVFRIFGDFRVIGYIRVFDFRVFDFGVIGVFDGHDDNYVALR